MTVDAPDPIEVTVICVTYRSREWILHAVRSAMAALDHGGLTGELLVVDNASDDATAELVSQEFPAVKLIRNRTNVGFGAANNQAFAVARGSAWLLINPDATLEPDAVGHLMDVLEADSRMAAVGPRIRGPGLGEAESGGMLPGIRSLAGHFLLLNRVLPRGWGGPWRGFQVRGRVDVSVDRVEWVSAAAVLLRPAAIREVGGFDASIFLYGEDLDMCARLLDRGWHVAMAPRARAWHAIGGSQAPGSTRWVDGLEQFMVRRGATRFYRAACFVCMAIGLMARALPWPRGVSGNGAADSLRMRSAAWRALAIAGSSLVGGRRLGR